MTAPGCGGADGIREQMAAALRVNWNRFDAEGLADALLPTVRAAMDRRVAEVLDEAAAKIRGLADGPVPAIDSAFDAVVILRAQADLLRNRSAALDGTP